LKRLSSSGLWAVAVVAVLIIAPLAALSASGEDSYNPTWWHSFTFDDEGSSYLPTLFTAPDNTPIATWIDSDGYLRLSHLELFKYSKPGLVLSNLPKDKATPINGMVDRVAMDANGILHVVWEDGQGGIWHKGYDANGNVVINNQRLSATEASASAPAIAATVSTEGSVAWVTWIETREHIGTHVRIASIDPSGVITASDYVDDWTQPFSPVACDVALDMDGAPHVSILADDGSYWAVPNIERGYDLLSLHKGDDISLPLLLFSPFGESWALWATDRDLAFITREMVDGVLGPEDNSIPGMYFYGVDPFWPRKTTLATAMAGGPLATATGDKSVYMYFGNMDGDLVLDSTLAFFVGAVAISVLYSTATTDTRGQTLVGGVWGDPFACSIHVWEKGSDVSISSNIGTSVDDRVHLRPGGSFEVPVTLSNIAGYQTEVSISVERVSSEGVFTSGIADTMPIIIDALGSETVGIRFSAQAGIMPGSKATFNIKAFHEDWPDVYTSMDIHVDVPEGIDFLVRGPLEPILAVPGETVFSQIVVESLSGDDKVVLVEVTVPKGWTFSAPAESPVPPNGQTEIPIQLSAPEGAPAGTEVEFDVTVKTTEGEEAGSASISATVIPHSAVVMEMGTQTLVVPRDSANMLEHAVSREVRVRNTGNQILEISFHAQPNREGWVAWTTPETVLLTPRSETSMVVWVGAPETAVWGSQAQVMIVVTHEEGPSLDVSYLPCSVERDTDYKPDFIPVETLLMNGWTEVDLDLVNKGNGFEEVTLELLGLPLNWKSDMEGYSGPVKIEPFGTRRLHVTLTAPTDTPPGEVEIVARMWGSDGPRTAWLKVHVPEQFNVDVQLESETRALTPPGTVVFPFTLASSGNAAGEARLSLEGLPYGWDYTFSTPDGVAVVSFPMDMGATRSAQLALRVPDDADGEHDVDLVVRSRLGDLLARIPLYVRLRLPDLTVLDMTFLPAEPREGTPVTVRARVVNLGMADAEDVTVVLKEGNTVIDRDTLSIVPSMGELEVVLYMVPNQGRRTMVLEVDPADMIRERSEANNVVKRHLDIGAPPEEPVMTPAVAQASVAIVLTVGILSLLGGTETGKYAFLTLIFIPLYTKIKKDRVLDHYLRGKIHGYIIANPGEHYNAIKEQLEITNGALSYHLRVLEREGYVRSRMDGIYKRFYPSDMKLPTTQRNISSFQEVILTIVKNNQGLSQKDIAKRIGASSQVINYHIKILEESELIKVDRSRRKSKVYAIDAPAPVVVPD
jgi:uncharacterized membrane protein/DNA-binding MarR family transcriptional regulator